jgi:hypothetical protein
MNYFLYDSDLYETISNIKPCSCNGKCIGYCNGESSISIRLRTPEEISKIKIERIEKEENKKRSISLTEYSALVKSRKLVAGITDKMIEDTRNSSRRRTLEKRELLRRIRVGSRAAGIETFPANL